MLERRNLFRWGLGGIVACAGLGGTGLAEAAKAKAHNKAHGHPGHGAHGGHGHPNHGAHGHSGHGHSGHGKHSHGHAGHGAHGHSHGHAKSDKGAILRPADDAALAGARQVALHNLHTGESVSTVYWEDGAYVPGALHEVSHVLRDFRTGDVHAIRPELMDLLHNLSRTLEVDRPFQVISGYRSPQTNAMLREESNGVAQHSLHMQGMAIDIRIERVPLARLHKAALVLQRGGVGYYPDSDFVHVDIGPVRRWG
jgi:uncharacterized protein YcbK (DUF882 family)